MNDPVTMRPATATDLPTIVAMRTRLNELELNGCAHASIQPLTLAEFTTIWARTLDDPNYCWRLLEAEGRVVGFGLIYLSSPRMPALAAFLHWAYLEPEHRSHGAGQMLIPELLDWAKAKGADRVELQFIDGNLGAERFWAKMGFQPYARKCVRYLSGERGA